MKNGLDFIGHRRAHNFIHRRHAGEDFADAVLAERAPAGLPRAGAEDGRRQLFVNQFPGFVVNRYFVPWLNEA